MNGAAAHHRTGAPPAAPTTPGAAAAPGAPTDVLQRGLDALAAQRAAMVDGDPARLAAAHADLDAWLAAFARAPVGGVDAVRIRTALDANAAVAQRAAASVQRALAALLPTPAAGTYQADGRTSDRTAARRSMQA